MSASCFVRVRRLSWDSRRRAARWTVYGEAPPRRRFSRRALEVPLEAPGPAFVRELDTHGRAPGAVPDIRRIGEGAKLFVDAGIIVSTAFISPYKSDRDRVRSIVEGDMIEINVKCALEICEQRDAKGLYQKARAGQIAEFTGISAPYEEPDNPVVIDSGKLSLNECTDAVINYLKKNKYLF